MYILYKEVFALQRKFCCFCFLTSRKGIKPT